MPHLDELTMRRLASHAKSRNGTSVPNTNQGPVFEYACWNWVLSGGTLTANAPTALETVINDLLELDYSDPDGVFVTDLHRQNLPHQYQSSMVDLEIMSARLSAARREGSRFSISNPNQQEFMSALVRIILRVNGLNPISSAQDNKYNVYVRSSNWWNADHWGLGLTFGPGMRGFYVQTVPNVPLAHGCEVIWDEGLDGVVVGIQELHQNQVAQLSSVPWSACRQSDSHSHRICSQPLSPGAGQCCHCGFVICKEHFDKIRRPGVTVYRCDSCREPQMRDLS